MGATRGSNSPRIRRRSFGIDGVGSGAGCRDIALFRQFGGREIPGAFARRGNSSAYQPGIENLVIILKSGEEEKLVPILIDSGMWQYHGTADRESRIVILVFRSRHAAEVGEPVIGVQDSVPGGDERGAMEILAAAFRHRTDDAWTLLIFIAVVRDAFLELADHFRVCIGGVAAVP